MYEYVHTYACIRLCGKLNMAATVSVKKICTP